MAASNTQQRVKRKWPARVLTALTVIGFAPFLSVLMSLTIAQIFGCALDEGGVHPCVIYGRDMGEMLNVMFVMGWLQFLTWPLLAIAAIGWLALFAAWVLRR